MPSTETAGGIAEKSWVDIHSTPCVFSMIEDDLVAPSESKKISRFTGDVTVLAASGRSILRSIIVKDVDENVLSTL